MTSTGDSKTHKVRGDGETVYTLLLYPLSKTTDVAYIFRGT
jgi:hypothetical protein